ncbi:MAG: DUF2905 domain-containing protein [Verrucomicrobiia bacterium]
MHAAELRAIMVGGIDAASFMNDMAKVLVVAGLALLALGGLFWLGGKLPWFGRLPGDIRIEREHFKFYFPLATCLIISILLTLLFRLLGKR